MLAVTMCMQRCPAFITYARTRTHGTGSPNSYNAVETLSTLRFGDRCSQIENLPEVNTYKSIEELTFMLAQTQSGPLPGVEIGIVINRRSPYHRPFLTHDTPPHPPFY